MSDSATPEPSTPRTSRAGKIAAAVITGCAALALVIAYLVSGSPGTDAGAERASTPGASATAQPARPATDAATEPATEATAGPATEPAGDEAAEGPTEAAPNPSTEATAEARPSAEGGADGSGQPEGPAGNEAELATIEQPVSEPVALDEPASVSEGISVKVGSLEAIEAEALGVGEIAGPALRFVVTVDNTTGAPVALDTAMVNLEYGPEKLPAVQLTGSGAKAFPPSVEAGASATATLVFAVPADQRDQIRILLSVEASSPIAAFEGAAPGEKG